MEEAEGYRQRLIAMAEGDASRFKQLNTEYAKAPEVTRSRLYLETMQQVYSNTSKVMVDAKGQGNLLYLPLDKLMQSAGAAYVAPSDGADTAIVPKTGLSGDGGAQTLDRADMRSREALRSRDREAR